MLSHLLQFFSAVKLRKIQVLVIHQQQWHSRRSAPGLGPSKFCRSHGWSHGSVREGYGSAGSQKSWTIFFQHREANLSSWTIFWIWGFKRGLIVAKSCLMELIGNSKWKYDGPVEWRFIFRDKPKYQRNGLSTCSDTSTSCSSGDLKSLLPTWSPPKFCDVKQENARVEIETSMLAIIHSSELLSKCWESLSQQPPRGIPVDSYLGRFYPKTSKEQHETLGG